MCGPAAGEWLGYEWSKGKSKAKGERGDEKKSNTRTIRPMGFKQVSARGGTKISLCVHGHCDLRDEARVFALKRMSKLRIHDR